MLQAFTLTGNRVISGQADFLRYDNDSQVALRVRADGQDLGQLWPGESLELAAPADYWEIKGAVDGVEATGTLRIGTGRIRTSRRAQLHRPPVLVMETDVAPVNGSDPLPGWVSGTPANLAASATVHVLFDLGADWAQYGTLQLNVRANGPSSGYSVIAVSGRDTAIAAQNQNRMLRDASAASFAILYTALTTANGYGTAMLRPAGRYVVVSLTNADASNAIGSAAKATLTVYPS